MSVLTVSLGVSLGLRSRMHNQQNLMMGFVIGFGKLEREESKYPRRFG